MHTYMQKGFYPFGLYVIFRFSENNYLTQHCIGCGLLVLYMLCTGRNNYDDVHESEVSTCIDCRVIKFFLLGGVCVWCSITSGRRKNASEAYVYLTPIFHIQQFSAYG